MVKINLPQLATPELPSVTSKVADNFVPAKKIPQSPAVQDLVNSLSGFSDSLGRYNLVKEERKKVTDEAQAIADFEQIKQNKDGFKKLVAEKVIPEGASPYYINQLAKSQLKQDAREFKAKIFDEWNKSNVFRDDDPLAFDKFFQSKSKEFYDEKKLGSYNPATIAEAFLPDANAAYAELNQVHRAKQIAEIERVQGELLFKETNNSIADAFKVDEDQLDLILYDFPGRDKLSNYEKRLLYASQLIQTELDTLTEEGMNFNTANEIVIDAITQYARETENVDYLSILNNVITDKNSGSKLGDTAYAKDETVKANDYILQNNRQNIKFNSWLQSEVETQNSKKVNEDYFAAFDEDIEVLRNTEAWIEQWKIDNPDKEISLQTYTDLINTRNILIDSLTTDDIIPDDELIRDLQIDVITNPRRGNLRQEIQQGMRDKVIPYDVGVQMIKDLTANFDLKNSIYLTDPVFEQLSQSFEASLEPQFNYQETAAAKKLRLNTELAFMQSAYIQARQLQLDENSDDATKLTIFINFMKDRRDLLLDSYLKGLAAGNTELNIQANVPKQQNNTTNSSTNVMDDFLN